MVATSQETAADPAGDKGLSPESKNTAEPQTVPLAALAEERAKKREASERAEKAEAELAKLQAQLNSKNDGKQDASTPDSEDVRQAIRELQEDRRRTALARELGLDEKQAAAVRQVMQDAPKLNAEQALQVAKFNDEKLFQSQAADQAHPAMHGSLGTSRGAQPQPQVDDSKARWAYVDTIKNRDQVRFDEYKNNAIGHEAAKAMGLPHQLIPIPKT